MQSGKNLRRTVVAAAVIAAGVACAFAEDVAVQRRQVDVLSSKGPDGRPPIATLHQGDHLNVVAHEDRWLKVSVNGQDGYVFAPSLENTGGGFDLNLGGGNAPAEKTTSAAGKGWDNADWARSNNMSTAGVETMLRYHDALLAKKPLPAFMAEGHVGKP